MISPRRWPSHLVFWIALATCIYTPWVDTTPEQGNMASDLAAIESLVERGTLSIDGSTFENTLDKFRRFGRFYSHKPPVFQVVAAVPYYALHAAGLRLSERPGICIRAITWFAVIAPMGWLLWLIYTHPWMRETGERTRLAWTLAFAMGSLLTPFAVTLNHYIPAAAFLMAAWNVIASDSQNGKRPGWSHGLRCGFFISASFACEIPPAFIFGTALAGVWIVQAMKSPADSLDGASARGRDAPGSGAGLGRFGKFAGPAGLLLGAAPLTIAFIALNQITVGSPLPSYFHWQYFTYEGSFWAARDLRIAAGDLTYYEASAARRIFHALFGHRGIFWMMPLLAVAAVRAIVIARRGMPGGALAGTALGFVLAVTGLAMALASDAGGGAYVIRHAFPAVPLLYVVLGLGWRARPDTEAAAITKSGPTWIGKIAIAVAAIWGVLIAWIGVLAPWSHNVLSAIAPVENVARLALRSDGRLPIAWIDTAIEKTSITPANAWLDLGLEHQRAGRLKAAELSLRRAIAARPEVSVAYYHLGIVQDMRGKPRRAIETYAKLIELEPSNLGAWNNLGIFALRSGQSALARRAYSKSNELSPDNASALWGLIVLGDEDDLAFGDTPEAGALGSSDGTAALLEKALRLYPGDPRFADLAARAGSGSNAGDSRSPDADTP